MLFEIFSNLGNRVFYTSSESAIPEKERLVYMAKVAGYTYKLDGKTYKVIEKEK